MAHVQSPIITLGYGFYIILRLLFIRVPPGYSNPSIGFVNRSKELSLPSRHRVVSKKRKKRNLKDIEKRRIESLSHLSLYKNPRNALTDNEN